MSDILTSEEIENLRDQYHAANQGIAHRRGKLAGLSMRIGDLEQEARDLRTEIDALEMQQAEALDKVLAHMAAEKALSEDTRA